MPWIFVDFIQVKSLWRNCCLSWTWLFELFQELRCLLFNSKSVSLSHFDQLFLQILGVIAVSASVIPWILIPVFPLLIVFIYLRRYFLQTSRDVKRLESTSEHLPVQQWKLAFVCSWRAALCVCVCDLAARSPVFSHLSSSLQGLWTIRAFQAEDRFQKAFDDYQDLHSRQKLEILPYHTGTLTASVSLIYVLCFHRSLVPLSDHVPLVRCSPGYHLFSLCYVNYLWLLAAQRP